MIVKIAGICIFASCICLLLKQSGKGEQALLLALAASVYVLAMGLSQASGIVETVKTLAQQSGLDSGIFTSVIKITGIAYVAQTASELCRDAGEGALASKVELSAKLMICAVAVPAVEALFDVITGIL